MRNSRRRRLRLLLPVTGLLLVNGCLAALERNIDLLLSPEAGENLLQAPYSPVAGVLEFLVRHFRG